MIQTATSQSDGTFEFTDLMSGSYKIEARTVPIIAVALAVRGPRYPYLGSAEVTDLRLNAGEFLEGVQLSMSAAAAIDGVVSDSSGVGVVGAALTQAEQAMAFEGVAFVLEARPGCYLLLGNGGRGHMLQRSQRTLRFE